MGSEIKFILFLIDFLRKVNPLTPRPEGLVLPFDKLKGMTGAEGLGAAEWVKKWGAWKRSRLVLVLP